MLLDALTQFVPFGTPLSLVAGAGVSIRSNIYDILGQGVGQAPANIIGNVSTFGSDMGIGVKKPLLDCVVGTGFTTGNAATLNVAFQGAPDTGLAGGYQPGAWTTYVETGPMAVANLTAGAIVARFDWPPVFPVGEPLPRFLSLLFSPAAATNFTAGTINFALLTMDRDDWAAKFAAKNFTVA